MKQPVKPLAIIDKQTTVPAWRGLALDRAVAEQWLRSFGYYQLSGYRYPYREIGDPSQQEHRDQFRPNATFDDVVRLYEIQPQVAHTDP